MCESHLPRRHCAKCYVKYAGQRTRNTVRFHLYMKSKTAALPETEQRIVVAGAWGSEKWGAVGQRVRTSSRGMNKFWGCHIWRADCCDLVPVYDYTVYSKVSNSVHCTYSHHQPNQTKPNQTSCEGKEALSNPVGVIIL